MLVHDELLGDRMPSELLCRMRVLAEDAPTDSALIKQLFFLNLQPQVKAILTPIVEKSSVDVIASLADKVMDFTKGPITASIPQSQTEVSTFSTATGNTSQVAILDAMEQVTKEVRKLVVGRSQSPRRRYKSRSPSPHHRCHSNKPGLCFYHSRFGTEVRRCKISCSFLNQGNLNRENWARHTLHKIYGTTVPILLRTPYPKHVVWLTHEHPAVFGHWNSSLRSHQCRPSHCKR